MVSVGEVLNGLTHLVGEPVEFGVDPALEAGEVGVAVGEQVVVLQPSPSPRSSSWTCGDRFQTMIDSGRSDAQSASRSPISAVSVGAPVDSSMQYADYYWRPCVSRLVVFDRSAAWSGGALRAARSGG